MRLATATFDNRITWTQIFLEESMMSLVDNLARNATHYSSGSAVYCSPLTSIMNTISFIVPQGYDIRTV